MTINDVLPTAPDRFEPIVSRTWPWCRGFCFSRSYDLDHPELIDTRSNSLLHSSTIQTELPSWAVGKKALEYADEAVRLSPRDPILPGIYFQKASAYFMAQQDEQTIEWLRRALSAWPQWSHANALLAAQLALSGNEVEARDVLKRYFSLRARS
jgi:tetratricopeptide (TPR) repeat protein